MTTLEIIEILVRIAWIGGAVAFVLGLGQMNSPATARNGNLHLDFEDEVTKATVITKDGSVIAEPVAKLLDPEGAS